MRIAYYDTYNVMSVNRRITALLIRKIIPQNVFKLVKKKLADCRVIRIL